MNPLIEKLLTDQAHANKVNQLINNINTCTVLKTVPSADGENCLLRAILLDGHKVVTRFYPHGDALNLFIAEIGMGDMLLNELFQGILPVTVEYHRAQEEYVKFRLGECLADMIDEGKKRELQLAVRKMKSGDMRKKLKANKKRTRELSALKDVCRAARSAIYAGATREQLDLAVEMTWNEVIAARVIEA